MICINDPKAALHTAELARHESPQMKLLVRSYDSRHAVKLIRGRVHFQVRETVESAYIMGPEGSCALGHAELDIEGHVEDIGRQHDKRLVEQVQADAISGRNHLHVRLVPEPLTKVLRHKGSDRASA